MRLPTARDMFVIAACTIAVIFGMLVARNHWLVVPTQTQLRPGEFKPGELPRVENRLLRVRVTFEYNLYVKDNQTDEESLAQSRDHWQRELSRLGFRLISAEHPKMSEEPKP